MTINAISPSEALTIQTVGKELLILDQRAGLIHQLNETAALIWQKCEAGHTPQEMAQCLAENYEIGEEVAAMEVVVTLQKLRTLNLVD